MMTKKEQTGLSIIYGHAGKRYVYESYKKTDPGMAEKYLQFISKNQTVQYISWNNTKKKFTC
ncbi:MAG: hypothetical protein H8D45_22175 [Bacteroidetes bacterium]|nr:hypothetical protein [Bacteroidota bacterium]MBL7103797.1 hypothetical protein [Bacteroidales bacterium]